MIQMRYNRCMKQDLPTQLPRSLWKFFWDVDQASVDPSKREMYIINRLLDKGDLEAARWVLKTYPKDTIIETFKTQRDFSPWNGTFWSHYLQISQEEVACLQPSYLSMRKKLWPY